MKLVKKWWGINSSHKQNRKVEIVWGIYNEQISQDSDKL